MKKFIIAFGAGMGMTLLVMMVGLNLTYTQNLPAFVFAVDAAVLVGMLGVYIGMAYEQIKREEEMEDEVTPIPKAIKVTNDRVEKDPPSPPKTDSNADRSKEGKRIKIALEGEHSTLMEETLKEATRDA